MDIRKLQRAIVDGLEDVKGQNIVVFNTEHLSPLFERVIIASGTSNRQTKALASSVRDAVKSRGFTVMRTEGEDNGEWIIVDCGAAVVHVMQPAIRDYYHLEEIWGDKPVRLKIDARPTTLVKASGDGAAEPDEAPAAPARKGAARKNAPPAAKKAAAKTARTAAGRLATKTASPAAKAPAKKAAAKKAPAAPVPAKTAARTARTAATRADGAARPVAAKKAAPRKAAGGVTRTVGVKRAAATTTAARKAPAKKAPAAKKAAAKAPARKSARG